MTAAVLVAVGGAMGSVLRLWLSTGVQRHANTLFPIGTFVVNVVGCFVYGVIVGAFEESFAVGPRARMFFLTGVLGGFTTFSTFTFETLQLTRDSEFRPATINVFGQFALGLVSMWVGHALVLAVRRR